MKATFKILFLGWLIFNFSIVLHAQQSTFSYVFEDAGGSAQAYSIVKSFDSNFMIVGSKDVDGLLLKMDPEGNILWDNRFHIDNKNTMFSQIIRTADSCFVIAGNDDSDFIVIKITSTGETLWSKSIDLGYYDYPVSLQQTTDNGFILGGYSYQLSPSYLMKMSIVKINTLGEIDWAYHLSNGSNRSKAYSVRQMPDGGFIVAGEASNGPDYYDASLSLLNSSGSIVWSKILYTPLQGTERFFDVKVSDTNLICYGKINNSKSCILKTDLNGNVIWAKPIPSYSDDTEQYGQPLPSIHTTTDGGFAFVSPGSFFGGGSLIKIDSEGSFIWAQSQELSSVNVVESYDEGFITIGNGPLIGVKVVDNNNLQIGVIKSDALGNGTECSYLNGIIDDTITATFVEDTLMISEAETTSSSLQTVISNSGLSSRYGCVAFIGAVDEIESPAFSILPNPTRGNFQIQLNPNESLHFNKLNIFNTEGRLVFQNEDASVLQNTIDLTSQPSGIYFVQIIFQEKTFSQKFIVQH